MLDTSFIYAFFYEKDFHHKDVIQTLKKLDGEILFTPIEVVQELLTVVTRKFSSEEAIKIGKLIMSEDSWILIFKSHEADFEHGWKVFQKMSPHKFSFVDSLLIGIAKNGDNSVLTFDKEILKVLS